jgi:signal transduction histidine kinase
MTELEKLNSTDSGDGDSAEADAGSVAAAYELRLDEIAQLVARVRHEINNPLTGVLGQAQLLLREDLSETARKRAQTIEGLAIRLRDVVGQLRDVQKTPKAKEP